MGNYFIMSNNFFYRNVFKKLSASAASNASAGRKKFTMKIFLRKFYNDHVPQVPDAIYT